MMNNLLCKGNKDFTESLFLHGRYYFRDNPCFSCLGESFTLKSIIIDTPYCYLYYIKNKINCYYLLSLLSFFNF